MRGTRSTCRPSRPSPRGGSDCRAACRSQAAYLGAPVSVPVHYFTDPGCLMSWGHEPNVRRLMVEFGDSLEWRFVMGGLKRDYKGHERGARRAWAIDAGLIDMPIDSLFWDEGRSSS